VGLLRPDGSIPAALRASADDGRVYRTQQKDDHKIGEFRAAVDSPNWNRRGLSGATRQEFVAMDVWTRLERHIVDVTGLLPQVHARFADNL